MNTDIHTGEGQGLPQTIQTPLMHSSTHTNMHFQECTSTSKDVHPAKTQTGL